MCNTRYNPTVERTISDQNLGVYPALFASKMIPMSFVSFAAQYHRQRLSQIPLAVERPRQGPYPTRLIEKVQAW